MTIARGEFHDVASRGHCDFGYFDKDAHRGKGIDCVMALLVNCFAGPDAERIVRPDPDIMSNSGEKDSAVAMMIAAVALHEGPVPASGKVTVNSSDPRFVSAFDLAVQAATRMVKENGPVIAKVADLLLKRSRLSGEEVAAIVREYRPALFLKAPGHTDVGGAGGNDVRI